MTPRSMLLACMVASLPLTAGAAVWDGTGGVGYNMPAENYEGPGPVTTDGFVWSSTNGTGGFQALFGYTGNYAFLENGYRYGGIPMAAVNSSTDSMTFTFAHPTSAFGGTMNWAPSDGSPVTVVAYDSMGIGLDSLVLSDGNDTNSQTPSAFYGFIEGSPDIASVVLTGGVIGIWDIELIQSAPEPATWALMLVGFGGVGSAMRRARTAKGPRSAAAVRV